MVQVRIGRPHIRSEAAIAAIGAERRERRNQSPRRVPDIDRYRARPRTLKAIEIRVVGIHNIGFQFLTQVDRSGTEDVVVRFVSVERFARTETDAIGAAATLATPNL